MTAAKTPGRAWATRAGRVGLPVIVALLLLGAQGAAAGAAPGDGLYVYGRNESALVYLWADQASQSLYLDYQGLSQGLSFYRILDLWITGSLAQDVHVEGRLKNRVGEWRDASGAGSGVSLDLPWTSWGSSGVQAGWASAVGTGPAGGGVGAGGYAGFAPEDEIWVMARQEGRTPWGLRIGDFAAEAGWWSLLPYRQNLVGAAGEIQLGAAALGGFLGETRGGLVREPLMTVGLVVTYYLSYPPVASGSETVRLSGRTLVRGRDYDIDYETGELRLSSFSLPGEVLDVSYVTLMPGVGRRSQAYGVLARVSSGDTEAGVFVLGSDDSGASSLEGALRVVRRFERAGALDVEVGRVGGAVPASVRLSLRGAGIEAAAALRADSLAALGGAGAGAHYDLDLRTREGVFGPVTLGFSWARDESPAVGTALAARVTETRRVTAGYSPLPGAGLSLGYQESLLGSRSESFWDLEGVSAVRTVTARGYADGTSFSLPGLSVTGTLAYRIPDGSGAAVVGSLKAGYRPEDGRIAVDAEYDRSTSYSQERKVRLNEKGSVKVDMPLGVLPGQELRAGAKYSFDSEEDRLGLLLEYRSESGLWAEADVSEVTYLSIGYSGKVDGPLPVSLRAEAGAAIQDLRMAGWEAGAEIAAASLLAGGARGDETSAHAGQPKGGQVGEFLVRHGIEPSAAAMVHIRRLYDASDAPASLRGSFSLELRFDVRHEVMIKVSGGYLFKEDYENPADGYRAAGIATGLSVAF